MSDLQETLKRVPLENPWAAVVVAATLGYGWLSDQVNKAEKAYAEADVLLQKAEAIVASVDDMKSTLRQIELEHQRMAGKVAILEHVCRPTGEAMRVPIESRDGD